MIRSLAVLMCIGIHYILTWPMRNKYKVGNAQNKQEAREKIYRLMQGVSRHIIRAAGTKVIVTGRENLPQRGPVLYVANHKSNLDSVVIASVIEDPCIFISKEELKKVPVISGWVKALGSISIDRQDMKSSVKAIVTGINELKQGQSLMIFPEGKRYPSKEMGEFKAGSFKLALKAGVPIVPITLEETYKILEETGWIKQATVYMHIGKPIYVASLSEEEKKQIHLIVQEQIKAMITC